MSLWRDSKAIMNFLRINRTFLRMKFLQGNQKKFITEISIKSGLSTEKLAKLAGVHPRSFRDWKREKLSMTLRAAELFCKKFDILLPEDKKTLVERWKLSKIEASRMGGKALFKKWGSPATPEGRRKGGINTLTNLRRNGIIPLVKVYKDKF